MDRRSARQAPRRQLAIAVEAAAGTVVVAAAVAALGAGCSPPRDCLGRIWHRPHRAVDRVVARGDFDGWRGTALQEICPCVWYAGLELAPGDYRYTLEVDGQPADDPLAPLSGWTDDGETETSLLRIEDCSVPAWQVDAAEATADGAWRGELTFLRASSGEALDRDTVTATLLDGSALDVERGAAPGQVIVSTSGLPPGKHTAVIEGADRAGEPAEPLWLPLWVEDEPFSWDGALIYQVVVDRFAADDGPVDGLDEPGDIGLRRGGTLDGLRRVLDDGYFDDLGVRALWISPMHDNPEGLWPGADGHDYESYHGYWPVAPREVEPAFGGADALDALIAAAHARGVRVLLDVVPNHVHVDHPYFAANEDAGWFHDAGCVCGAPDCPWDEHIESCWFTPYLADIDHRNPDALRQQVDDVLWWVERFDLDGVRVDAVPMMPRSASRDLVYELQRRFERGPTPLYVVGETYTGAGGWGSIQRYLGPYGLDGQFDFPVMWTLRAALADGTATMADLADAIEESQAAWAGPAATMAPMIGNHDVTRFLSEAAGDTGDPWDDPPAAPDDDEPYRRLLLAHAAALTLPGAPVLYYGDEFGLPGSGDPDNRRPMRFGDELSAREADTLARVARLGRARACLPALRHGDWAPVWVDDDSLAYLRDAGDGAPALAILNRANTSIERRSFPIPDDALAYEPLAMVDALSGQRITVRHGATDPLTVPPMTAMLLVPEHSACAEPDGKDDAR